MFVQKLKPYACRPGYNDDTQKVSFLETRAFVFSLPVTIKPMFWCMFSVRLIFSTCNSIVKYLRLIINVSEVMQFFNQDSCSYAFISWTLSNSFKKGCGVQCSIIVPSSLSTLCCRNIFHEGFWIYMYALWYIWVGPFLKLRLRLWLWLMLRLPVGSPAPKPEPKLGFGKDLYIKYPDAFEENGQFLMFMAHSWTKLDLKLFDMNLEGFKSDVMYM